MLGARAIEKHFTLSHAAKGTDHAFSLMPEGMRKLVRDLRRIPDEPKSIDVYPVFTEIELSTGIIELNLILFFYVTIEAS
jgi:sialic acid synthase SpsE